MEKINLSSLVKKGVSRKGVTNSRSSGIRKNVVWMFLANGINILISLMYVPLLINTLNNYNYGLWLTITSIIAWVNLSDIGLGNGLRNKLSESLADGHRLKAKKYISTSYAAIGLLSLVLIVVFMACNQFVQWSNVLNAPESMEQELRQLVSIVFILFCIQMFLRNINSILLAFQMPALSSIIVTIGQLLSFVTVAALVHFTGENSLIVLGSVISSVPILVLTVISLLMFGTRLKDYRPSFRLIKFSYLKDILGLGIKFFCLQIITILLYQTGNIIIAHAIGQESVTEYNVGYKYIGIISMIFTIVITPFWSACTEAYRKNELEWIKNARKNLYKIWGLLCCGGLVLLACAGFAYKIWLGNRVEVDYVFLAIILLCFCLRMFYALNGYILNGISKVKLQLIVTSILAILFIPSALHFSKTYGLVGFAITLATLEMLNAIWATIQLNKILSNKANGIWIQ